MSVFWDSSALVHLLCDQGATARAKDFLSKNSKMVVWWATTGECASAIARLEREQHLQHREANGALDLLSQYRTIWHEVLPSEPLLQRMIRLVRVHELRAADAFQLAAALTARGDRVAGFEFLSFDVHQCTAAAKEGLVVVDSF